MTQFEFYKSFQFVLELILAESLYAYKMHRRSYFVLRLIGALVVFFGFSYLFPVLVNNALYFSFTFLTIFTVSVLLAKFLFKETWMTVIFCCLAGYTTQHLAYELYTLMLNLTGANVDSPMGFYGSDEVNLFGNQFALVVYFFTFTVTYCVCFFLFSEKLPKSESVQFKTAFMFFGIVFILVIDIVLNAVVVYYLADDDKPLYKIIMCIYNILCCIIALYLQFEVALKRKLEDTLDRVEQMWHQAKEQYAVSKENVEMINVKCHDLKHQIRTLRKGGEINPEVLAELEERIKIYDSEIKTGNPALDIILSEKSLTCTKNNIKLSCIVDGEKLGFIKEEDIYALFGNIIDNAIEAVTDVEESKRTISLSVKTVNNFLTIRETNYYEHEIKFVGGMPETRKPDKRYHGFGLKSIKYICEHYGGELTIAAENNIFDLSILFGLD